MHRAPAADLPLSRAAASAVGAELGWRYLLGVLRTNVPVPSLAQAAEVGAKIAAACDVGGNRLLLDARGDRLVLTLQNPAASSVTAYEADLARRITAIVTQLGFRLDPGVGRAKGRSVQMLEIAIDAVDIAAIRPFWRAVLGYGDEPGRTGPTDPIVDPVGQGPAVWFQQMDEPRPQRNRIHLDISVPHDVARRRIQSALAAGGSLVSYAKAPAFWVLADAEGNEACVTTWQGRDGASASSP